MKDPMAALWQRLRGTPGPPRVPRTTILLASGRPDDGHDLLAILRDSRWAPAAAAGFADALHLQERLHCPIILYDQELPGAGWRDGIRAMIRLCRRPAIILLSDVADPYLWDEVVSAGGFDVLPRPFHREEALAMLDFAHRHWKSGWPLHGPTPTPRAG